MERRAFLETSTLAAASALVAGRDVSGAAAADEKAGAGSPSVADDFPLVDLHVHLTPEFPIERMVRLAQERNVTFGIVEHPASWAIKDDADLERYVEKLRPHPVYVGLQPMEAGWERSFSAEALAALDYVLMDPQTIPLPNGERQRIWELQTYVEDAEEFMERYVAHCLDVLRQPIQIFGWPLFLPVCIARDYYTLWTQGRMQAIVSAAKAAGIAIEINEMAHTPDERFIRMAKEQGLKFTFGSDARNANAGRLSYGKAVARKCGLSAADFYVPRRKGGKA